MLVKSSIWNSRRWIIGRLLLLKLLLTPESIYHGIKEIGQVHSSDTRPWRPACVSILINGYGFDLLYQIDQTLLRLEVLFEKCGPTIAFCLALHHGDWSVTFKITLFALPSGQWISIERTDRTVRIHFAVLFPQLSRAKADEISVVEPTSTTASCSTIQK